MQTHYTKAFKIEAVKKYLNRSIGETYEEAAESLGTSKASLHGWVKQMREGKMEEGATSGPLERRPRDWTSSEKFEAILEVENMSEEEKNSYCRSKGIFPHHLQAWKQEFKAWKGRQRKDKSEAKALRAENKQLKKELRRKESRVRVEGQACNSAKSRGAGLQSRGTGLTLDISR